MRAICNRARGRPLECDYLWRRLWRWLSEPADAANRLPRMVTFPTKGLAQSHKRSPMAKPSGHLQSRRVEASAAMSRLESSCSRTVGCVRGRAPESGCRTASGRQTCRRFPSQRRNWPTTAPMPPPPPEPMAISRMLLQTIHGRRSPAVRASLKKVALAARRCSRCGCAAPGLAGGRGTRGCKPKPDFFPARGAIKSAVKIFGGLR